MSTKPSNVELADTVSDLMYGIAGWLLIGLGVAAFLSGASGIIRQAGTADIVAPLLVLGFGLLFTALGMFVNPRFRRRLDRREDPSRFGQIETVDSRILSTAENRHESCISCGSSLNEGLVRRYRQEYAVAGVPVWTISENYNYYCSDCAVEELSGPSTSGIDDSDITERAITETN